MFVKERGEEEEKKTSFEIVQMENWNIWTNERARSGTKYEWRRRDACQIDETLGRLEWKCTECGAQ